MSITAHCLVKNEARFVWYAAMSVASHVDRILLWDTGSTDGTLDIIDEINKEVGNKLNFREYGKVTPQTFTKVRQEMLDATTTDWFIIVDGDEIWWKESIKKVIEAIKIKGESIESIVVPTTNLIGDIYHYQEEMAGRYELAGRLGHLNLRAVNRKIPGLHSRGEHGVWGWVDGSGKMIQDRDQKKVLFIDAPYLHASFLPRAGDTSQEKNVPKRKQKLKYELGIPFPLDFYYPEVFFKARPKIIPSPWAKRSTSYIARAMLETPLKKIRRRIIKKNKTGY